MSEWHVLVVTKDGSVSLLRSLSEEVARETMQRLVPYDNPWSDARMQSRLMDEGHIPRPAPQHIGGSYYYVASPAYFPDSGYRQVDAWGPGGVDLDVWPQPADYEDRYAKAVAAAQLANRINSEIKENP